MDIMTLTQLAQLTDLAPPTVRRYLDDYILYVPSVRVEGTVGFPAEAVEVVAFIHRLTEAGHSHTEITGQLEARYPVTVISSQALADGESLPPVLPTIAGLLRDVDDRYLAVHAQLINLQTELSRMASDQRAQQLQQLVTSTATTTFRHFDTLSSVPADLTQIKQAIGVLATRLERSTTASQQERQALSAAVDGLAAQVSASSSLPTAGLAAIKAEVSEIRHTVTAQAMQAETATVEAIRPELDVLTAQITEMRQERAQMVSLMSALQDNLVQMHMELAALREQASLNGHHVSPNGHGTSNLITMPQQHERTDEKREGTDKLRTPRRLGHITGR
jgi:DNA-binding transcriptional MerR regulator